ncbi:hypothetical protein F5Y13DRAFT_194743 [Hypoxylon sp. FL1857]|nr:hypothetical protein F5Y13DRAFT_194743 [Hypoxylon sp. FL1857]
MSSLLNIEIHAAPESDVLPLGIERGVTHMSVAAARNLSKDKRSQPWKNFVKCDTDASHDDRTGDFITIRNIKDVDGQETHDYTAQLG